MRAMRAELTNLKISRCRRLLGAVLVRAVRDYKISSRYDLSAQSISVTPIDLPASDVLLYELGGEKGIDWACVRPSGTEPKLKIYFGIYGREKGAYFSAPRRSENTGIRTRRRKALSLLSPCRSLLGDDNMMLYSK